MDHQGFRGHFHDNSPCLVPCGQQAHSALARADGDADRPRGRGAGRDAGRRMDARTRSVRASFERRVRAIQ